MNKLNRNKLIDTESTLMVARREGDGEMGEIVGGIKKYKLIVTK